MMVSCGRWVNADHHNRFWVIRDRKGVGYSKTSNGSHTLEWRNKVSKLTNLFNFTISGDRALGFRIYDVGLQVASGENNLCMSELRSIVEQTAISARLASGSLGSSRDYT